MTSLLHLLNIATLAGWLSVVTFGSVGLVISPSAAPPPLVKSEHPTVQLPAITLGDEGTDSETEEAAADAAPAASAETFASPPALPDLAESAPLPEIPDLPPLPPAAKPTPQPREKPAITRPSITARPLEKKISPPHSRAVAAAKPSTGTSGKPTTPNGKPGGTGNGTNDKAGTSSGLSASARLAAGRMPKPNYPGEARRNNQTGTVTVAFTVDASGAVISAYAAASSSWPLLDAEAVRTVRRWSFPPGGIMKLQRPIVFRLN